MTEYHGIPKTDVVCRAFAHVAIETWRDIGDFRDLEEGSITDYRLLTLRRMCPNEVRMKKFTKWEESRNGADWEWWFGAGYDWFGMRVQAKKLNPATFEYPHLDYHIKRTNEFQVDRLIDDATARCLTPLYCLYNFWPEGTVNLRWPCLSYAERLELWGVAVADAFNVRDHVHTGRKNIMDFNKECFPLNCLACCRGNALQGGQGYGLPVRARGISIALHGNDEGISQIVPHPPQYVGEILEGKSTIEPPSPDLDGILVVQENLSIHETAFG